MRFKRLTPDEEREYEQWARDNYTPFTTIDGTWHPIVQAECVRMNEEATDYVEEEEDDDA